MIGVKTSAIRTAWAGVAMGVALLAVAGCKERTTPIGDLLAGTGNYEGQEVQVAGDVKGAAGAFGYGVYQLDDGTGTITVVTSEGGAPPEGSKVGVRGTFRSAFTIGTDAVAVIQESKRFTP